MSAHEALAKIQVVAENTAASGKRLHWMRRSIQLGALLLLVLIPVTGLFRIDVSSGFVVLDKQIWFADFHLVFGLWLSIACFLVLLYSTVGTAFCGWVCPQNSFSTWANKLTSKHLGKSALIDWNNEKNARLSKIKSNLPNWGLLTVKLLLGSMVFALLPLLYFNTPAAIWAFVTFQESDELASSLHWIYTVFVFIIFVNLAVVRHFVCRYMCIYRIWQFLFKTSDTLHIEYDDSRKEECEKCNYCVSHCMVDIDPRKTTTFDSCTNCGECITACSAMQKKTGGKSLLRFKFGNRKHKDRKQTNLATLGMRSRWVGPVFLLGFGLFLWGLISYEPYHMAVYRAELQQSGTVNNYRINIAHKIYESGRVNLEVEGLESDDYELDRSQLDFETAERADAMITITGQLEPGLHSFIVRATSEEGWEETVRVQHFVTERG